MRRVEYIQRHDQEPVRKEGGGQMHFESCCDCGLVHRVTYLALEDGSIVKVASRSPSATAARRRAEKFPCVLRKRGGR